MTTTSPSLGHAVTPGRLTLAATVATAGIALTGMAVFAGLNAVATNTTPQTVSSGTLELTMAANGDGFTQSITSLAPGDVVNRYVTLTNGGSLDANGLTLGVADASATKLTNDATKGLHATVTQCVGGTWNVTTGVCSGSATALLSNVALSALSSSANTLVSGAIPANSTYALQVSTTLPDQSETATNGTLPSGTIQNLSASLTWTFSENQRTATTTKS
jgi:hypothetical protein